jgi:hypothetical protein
VIDWRAPLYNDLPGRRQRRRFLGALVLATACPPVRCWRALGTIGEQGLRSDPDAWWRLDVMETLNRLTAWIEEGR